MIVPQVTEETGDESQVDVELSEASRGSPKPSHVTSVEETHEVIVTREDVTGFTEEETIPEEVEVTMNILQFHCDHSTIKLFFLVHSWMVFKYAVKRCAIHKTRKYNVKPSLLQVDLSEGGLIQRPMQNVNPLLETVPPDIVAEELSTSIKEIYMIPSTVRPEYEPSVVERYRFVLSTIKTHT